MNKFVKYSLWTACAGVLAVVLAVAYIVATFNPNDYKAQIIQLVKDKKQRTLKLDSDIKLTIFPSLGVSIGHVSLSEFRSEHEFAAIDSARASLALLPLLSKQLVVDEVAVTGLKVGLIKYKDGKTNYDDLMGTEESKPEGQPISFDIASVQVENSALRYRDETTGASYALQNIKLHTGRIASSTPSNIDISASIQANQPRLDIALQLGGTLSFDLAQQWYQMKDMKFQVKGTALDVSNLEVQASGDASAKLATQEFTARDLVATASGVNGKNKFDAKLNVPVLNLTKDKFSGDTLTVNARLGGAIGDITSSLTLHDLAGNAQLFKSSALTLELEMKQPDQQYKVKLNSPVSGNVEQQQLNLSNLTVAVHASGDKLPNKSVNSEMKGSVQIDGSRQNVQVNLVGGLLQSQVKIRAGIKNFTNPAIRFDVEADQFDADLYLPNDAGQAGKSSVAAEQPIDISALNELNLEGSLRIDALKVSNVKLAQVRLDMKARNGQLDINPLSARLYQGSINGSLSVNAQATPKFVTEQKFSGVSIAPLLKDVADLDILEGKGNVTCSLSAQGSTVSELKRTLNGNVALNLEDGAIKGINLGQRIHDAQALGKGGAAAQTQNANKQEKTEFSEFKASFKVKSGVAHNEDLSVKSQLLRLTGNGDINISNDSINYVAKATLSKTPDGQGGSITVPVHLSGPFADLKYRLDFGAMVADIARQKVEAKKEQIKSQVQEKLKGKLKDIFK